MKAALLSTGALFQARRRWLGSNIDVVEASRCGASSAVDTEGAAASTSVAYPVHLIAIFLELDRGRETCHGHSIRGLGFVWVDEIEL